MQRQNLTALKIWNEYPELDREYVSDYPLAFGELDPAAIWAKRPICCFVQIPFCDPVCDYCYWLKVQSNARLQEAYLAALKKEIRFYAQMPWIQDSHVVALYFGGGTPTLLSVKQLEDLFDHIRECIPLSSNVEIEVEAHPLHAERAKLECLRSNGVTRVSFGIQSFRDGLLRAIGSSHVGEDAIRAVELAHEIGFPKVAFDMIYNLPGATTEDWIRDIEGAVSLNPTSVSCYRLAIVPNTPIFRRASTLQMQDGEGIYRLWEEAVSRFISNGYRQYTDTCFAKPGKESRYILGAWKAPQLGVLGLGAGAVSSAIHGHMYMNISNPRGYMEIVDSGRLPVFKGKKITMAEWMSRYVVLGIRALKVSKDRFREVVGLRMDDIYADQLRYLRERDLVSDDEHTLRLTTPRGTYYASNVQKRFFSPENVGKLQPLGSQLIHAAPPAMVRESLLQFEQKLGV